MRRSSLPSSPRALADWVARRRRALLRLLKQEERERAGVLPNALRGYHRRFLMEFRSTPPRPCALRQVEKAVAAADIVFSADYHAQPRPERTHLRWLRLLRAAGRPVTLAVEVVSARHQRALDEFASGGLREAEFRRRINFDADWGFHWPPYRRLLRQALKLGCRLLAIDHPCRSRGVSVRERDRHAGEALGREAARRGERAILVVAGEMHLAGPHLPRETERACRRRGLKRRTLTLFHGSEGLYFQVGRRGLEGRVGALELGGGRYCLLQAAPWVRLLAHLRWLEGKEGGIAAGPEERAVAWTARTLALLAGVAAPGRPHSTEEIPAGRATASEAIARRALARVEQWAGRPCAPDARTREIWLTLARCLVDPPLPGGRGGWRSVAADGPGLRLYGRLVEGTLGPAELRAALGGRVSETAPPEIREDFLAARS
jgi:hypothetical protein